MFEGFPESDDNDSESHIPSYSEEEKVNVKVSTLLIVSILMRKSLLTTCDVYIEKVACKCYEDVGVFLSINNCTVFHSSTVMIYGL